MNGESSKVFIDYTGYYPRCYHKDFNQKRTRDYTQRNYLCVPNGKDYLFINGRVILANSKPN